MMSALVICSTGAKAQVAVDFSRPSGPPLVKTKFGVYQTPLTTLPRLLGSVALLREAGVRDFRYEIGWGKPESLASSQIGGTAANLRFDFSMLDALMKELDAAGVQPLLALGYCADPLKSRSQWAAWKDLPSNLGAWEAINCAYAAHLRARSSAWRLAPFFEVWNEPDMPEPNGKMFFSGTASDYGQLFARSQSGLRAGDADALVGGPAAAYDLSYLAPIVQGPLDFASIHGYANYGGQIAAMRAALSAAKRPDVPIFVTEYASFSDLPANGPQSRAAGAMRFLRDARQMLDDADVAKVYWAQWLDAGQGPGMGFITYDGHRKAIFNALKIYNCLPVDRVAISSDVAGIGGMAGVEANHAGVVLWNESDTARTLNVDFSHLPFVKGRARLFRIDAAHASYIDNPASENLQALETRQLPSNARAWKWSGTIPPNGVVFWQFTSAKTNKAAAPAPVGSVVRHQLDFADRHAHNFADFDARTTTARLWLGCGVPASVGIGALLQRPAARWRVQVESEATAIDRDSLLALRLDFPDEKGVYRRSVLFHQGFYNSKSDTSPWGNGTPDLVLKRNFSKGFRIDLARVAPASWNRGRVLVSCFLRDSGRGSRAKLVLSAR